MLSVANDVRRLALFIQLSAVFAFAQDAPLDRVRHAAELNDAGRFNEALSLVEPLLQDPGLPSSSSVAGMAWNVRGLALQNLGNPQEARKSYESAVEILRAPAAPPAEYAAALDNLGSVKAELGEAEESRKLRLRALSLYASAGDHLGMARVENSLILIALGEHHLKDARHYLDQASAELSGLASAPRSDQASLRVSQCLVDIAGGRFRDALSAIDSAIAIWRADHGNNFYLLSTGYSLRAQAYDGLGEHAQAVAGFQQALAILRSNGNSESSPLYLLTEISFAKALRHAGKKQDARRLEAAARQELNEVRPCSGCTVSAQSFR